MLFADFFDELWTKGAGVVFGLVFGAICTWAYARWRRYQERQSILAGDARETVVIQHHVI